MKAKRYSASKKPSPQQKSNTSSVSDMLTPSEIAQLQQDKKEANAYFQKLFAANHLKKNFTSSDLKKPVVEYPITEELIGSGIPDEVPPEYNAKSSAEKKSVRSKSRSKTSGFRKTRQT